MCGDQHVVASVKSLQKNKIERYGHQGFSEFSLHCPNHAHGEKIDPDSQNCQNTFCRDRIAPTCTIRHSVWPIVALQRRMRFSAPLARFCSIRCHQRRARRAERASFSVLVSNLDFRVPRSRQRGGSGPLTGAVQRRKRGRPKGPESRPGLSRCSRPSTFWSRCSPGLLDVHLSPGMDPGPRPKVWHPVSGRCFPARTGEPESPAATPGRNQRWIDFLRSTGRQLAFRQLIRNSGCSVWGR